MDKPDYRIEKIVGDEYVKFSSVNLNNMQYDCFLNICLCVDHEPSCSDCSYDDNCKDCYCVSDDETCDNKGCRSVSCDTDNDW